MSLHEWVFIFFRYTDALATNWERRKASQEKWNFSCQCNRCEDITEFQTYTSGLVCAQCDSGILLVDTKDKLWKCIECSYNKTHSEIWFTMLDPLQKSKKDCLLQQADESILEQWIWTAQKILHPNHVWILEVEYRLLFQYSKKVKRMKKGKKPIQLRMIQLGMHLLEVRLFLWNSQYCQILKVGITDFITTITFRSLVRLMMVQHDGEVWFFKRWYLHGWI